VEPGFGVSDQPVVPQELQGFSWAAFLWGGIWAVTYRVWIGLFAFVPILGLIMNVVLGMRGAEWAFRKGSIPDVGRYKSAQRNWVIAWVALSVFMIPAGVGMASAVTVYGVQKYVTNAKRAEAQSSLALMAKGMEGCAARGELPQTSQWVPADLSEVRGRKYQSTSVDWSSQDAFACSGAVLAEPQYFRYRWRKTTAASGQFEAEADLNGDGIVDLALQQGVHCAAGKCEIEPLLGDTAGARRAARAPR
jgi:hypothetical protein